MFTSASALRRLSSGSPPTRTAARQEGAGPSPPGVQAAGTRELGQSEFKQRVLTPSPPASPGQGVLRPTPSRASRRGFGKGNQGSSPEAPAEGPLERPASRLGPPPPCRRPGLPARPAGAPETLADGVKDGRGWSSASVARGVFRGVPAARPGLRDPGCRDPCARASARARRTRRLPAGSAAPPADLFKGAVPRGPIHRSRAPGPGPLPFAQTLGPGSPRPARPGTSRRGPRPRRRAHEPGPSQPRDRGHVGTGPRGPRADGRPKGLDRGPGRGSHLDGPRLSREASGGLARPGQSRGAGTDHEKAHPGPARETGVLRGRPGDDPRPTPLLRRPRPTRSEGRRWPRRRPSG